MNKGIIVGLILLIGGLIIWVAYGLYLGAGDILANLNLVTGLVAGLIIIGVIILIISVILEQTSDMQKRREEIKKEDFEP